MFHRKLRVVSPGIKGCFARNEALFHQEWRFVSPGVKGCFTKRIRLKRSKRSSFKDSVVEREILLVQITKFVDPLRLLLHRDPSNC